MAEPDGRWRYGEELSGFVIETAVRVCRLGLERRQGHGRVRFVLEVETIVVDEDGTTLTTWT